MRSLALFIAVAAIAIVQLYVAGPLGLAWDLDRHSVALAAFIGGMIGVIVLVIVGPAMLDAVTGFFRRLFRRPRNDSEEPAEEKPPGRFALMVDRFGAPFLGVVGPLTIGGWAAALVGRSAGMGRLQLILWLAVGQAIVSAGYVYALAEITD